MTNITHDARVSPGISPSKATHRAHYGAFHRTAPPLRAPRACAPRLVTVERRHWARSVSFLRAWRWRDSLLQDAHFATLPNHHRLHFPGGGTDSRRYKGHGLPARRAALGRHSWHSLDMFQRNAWSSSISSQEASTSLAPPLCGPNARLAMANLVGDVALYGQTGAGAPVPRQAGVEMTWQAAL